jgi:hypothetical protein
MASYPDGIDGSDVHDFICMYIHKVISLDGNYVPTIEEAEFIKTIYNGPGKKRRRGMKILGPNDFYREIESLVQCIAFPHEGLMRPNKVFKYEWLHGTPVAGDLDVSFRDYNGVTQTIEVKGNGKAGMNGRTNPNTVLQIAKQAMFYKGQPVMSHLFGGHLGHIRITREDFIDVLEGSDKLTPHKKDLLRNLIESDFFIDP